MPNNRKVFAISSLCTGCRTCEIACAIVHSKSKTLVGALSESPFPKYRIEAQYSGQDVYPLNCRHCEEPDCLFACKAGAVSKDRQTGQVQVNLNTCVGCWMCVMVCPFGAVWPNRESSKALKCDLCEFDPEGPACVKACPTGALVYGRIEDVEAFIDAKTRAGILVKSA